MKLATAKAAEIVEAWRSGGDPEVLAAEANTTVVPVDAHRRGSAWGSLGVLPVVDEAVYEGSAGAVLEPVVIPLRGAVVARVRSVNRLSDEDIENEREATRSRLMNEQADFLLQALIADRQRETPVTVDEEFVAQFAPRG